MEYPAARSATITIQATKTWAALGSSDSEGEKDENDARVAACRQSVDQKALYRGHCGRSSRGR